MKSLRLLYELDCILGLLAGAVLGSPLLLAYLIWQWHKQRAQAIRECESVK